LSEGPSGTCFKIVVYGDGLLADDFRVQGEDFGKGVDDDCRTIDGLNCLM
jgi:hypothetical protein